MLLCCKVFGLFVSSQNFKRKIIAIPFPSPEAKAVPGLQLAMPGAPLLGLGAAPGTPSWKPGLRFPPVIGCSDPTSPGKVSPLPRRGDPPGDKELIQLPPPHPDFSCKKYEVRIDLLIC